MRYPLGLPEYEVNDDPQVLYIFVLVVEDIPVARIRIVAPDQKSAEVCVESYVRDHDLLSKILGDSRLELVLEFTHERGK